MYKTHIPITCYKMMQVEKLDLDPAAQRTLADQMLAEEIIGFETYIKLTSCAVH